MNDIEVLEKFTKIVKGKDYNAENGWHGYYDDELIAIGKAIENLLKERQSDKERIEELEERIKIYALNGDNIKLELYIKNNYIPKSLIKEKIEELDKQRIKMEKDDIGVGFTLGKEWSDLKAKIQVLEELLKGE